MFTFFRNLKEQIANASPFRFSLDAVTVSWRELKTISILSAFFALILFLPYLYAYLYTPPDLHFLGCFGYVPDQNMHLAWSYQAAQGVFFGKNLFTSIPHEGAVINLFLFAIGILSKITGLSLDSCYQISRVCTSWILGISAYYFVSLFFTGKARFWGWIAVLFTSGFGWIYAGCNQIFHWQMLGKDLVWKTLDGGAVIEAFVGLSMLYVPLYSMAIIMLFMTLRWAYIAMVLNHYKMAFIAGISLLLVNFIHPYDAIIIVAILCAIAFLLTICYPKQWKQWICNALIICMLGTPSLIYNYWILQTNPGLTMWPSQNLCPSVSLINFLTGLGILAICSVLWLLRLYNIRGIRLAITTVLVFLGFFLISAAKHLSFIPIEKYEIIMYIVFLPILLFWHLQSYQKNRQEFVRFILITTWILLFPILVYSPVTYQRRLSTGLNIPFAILFIDYMRIYIEKKHFHSQINNLIYFSIITLASLTTFYHYNYTWHFATFYNENKDFLWPSSFVKKDLINTLLIIEQRPETGSVLGTRSTSLLITRYAGKQVVTGSGGQTENFNQTQASVHQFYSGDMSSLDRHQFLKEKHVGYIFYGPEEQLLDPSHSLPTWLEHNHWIPIRHPHDKTYTVFVKEHVTQ